MEGRLDYREDLRRARRRNGARGFRRAGALIMAAGLFIGCKGYQQQLEFEDKPAGIVDPTVPTRGKENTLSNGELAERGEGGIRIGAICEGMGLALVISGVAIGACSRPKEQPPVDQAEQPPAAA